MRWTRAGSCLAKRARAGRAVLQAYQHLASEMVFFRPVAVQVSSSGSAQSGPNGQAIPDLIGLSFLRKGSMVGGWLLKASFRRRMPIMAKGMEKRRRDEKKPKKVVPKVLASAPSLKNTVAAAPVLKAKPK